MKERLAKPSGSISNGFTSSEELGVIEEGILLENGHKETRFDSTLIVENKVENNFTISETVQSEFLFGF